MTTLPTVSSGTQRRRPRRCARAAVRFRLGYDVRGDYRRSAPAHGVPSRQLPPDRPDQSRAAGRRASRPGGRPKDLRIRPAQRRRHRAHGRRSPVRPPQTGPAVRTEPWAWWGIEATPIAWSGPSEHPKAMETASMTALAHPAPAAPIRVPAGTTAAAAVRDAGLPGRGAPAPTGGG